MAGWTWVMIYDSDSWWKDDVIVHWYEAQSFVMTIYDQEYHCDDILDCTVKEL